MPTTDTPPLDPKQMREDAKALRLAPSHWRDGGAMQSRLAAYAETLADEVDLLHLKIGDAAESEDMEASVRLGRHGESYVRHLGRSGEGE